MHPEGMRFHFGAGHGELANRGMGRGGGGMATGAGNRIFQIQQAFFSDTDEGAAAAYTGKDILHNGAAFIQHQAQLQTLILKVADDVFRTGAVNLFSPGKGKINIMLRLKALPDQVLCSGEDAVESHLGVQGAAAPHDAVLNDSLKRRFPPVLLLYGDHVVMGHQDCGIPVGLSLPVKKQASALKALQGAGFPDAGIKGRQEGYEFFKFRIIFKSRIFI